MDFSGILKVEGYFPKKVKSLMIITSVSLPASLAVLWQRKQRRIMRVALRSLRIQIRKNPVRRGVPRRYNRFSEPAQIVTTRLRPAEYDALHFVAASLRVSVSLLVYLMIILWKKPARRKKASRYVTNHELNVTIWNRQAAVLTESLFVWPKQKIVEITLHDETQKILI